MTRSKDIFSSQSVSRNVCNNFLGLVKSILPYHTLTTTLTT